MGKDRKGVLRAECRAEGCDCKDFCNGDDPNDYRCRYCGHYPANHRNADSPVGTSTSYGSSIPVYGGGSVPLNNSRQSYGAMPMDSYAPQTRSSCGSGSSFGAGSLPQSSSLYGASTGSPAQMGSQMGSARSSYGSSSYGSSGYGSSASAGSPAQSSSLYGASNGYPAQRQMQTSSPMGSYTSQSRPSYENTPYGSSGFGASSTYDNSRLNSSYGAPRADPFAQPARSSDPFAQPTRSSDPFAQPTRSSDPFAQPTRSSDPFAQPARSSDPFAQPTRSSDPSGPDRLDPFRARVPPAASLPTEHGGWPLGTMAVIKAILTNVSDEVLKKAMTSVSPTRDRNELVDKCLELGGGLEEAAREWPPDVIDILAAQLSKDFPRERIERAVANHPVKGQVDAVLAKLLNEDRPEPEFDCEICFDKFKVSDMYTVDCPGSHRFCYACIGQGVVTAINDGAPVMCPAQGCEHELNDAEVEQISRGPNSPVTKELVEKHKNQLLRRAIEKIPGIVGCPTPGCGNWIIPSDITKQERCECGACHAVFCSLCRGPYHYGCDCATVRKVQQRWMEWMANGRQQYNRDKADALKKMEDARAAIEQRNKDMQARYNDMLLDEEFKRQNGRYCPKCHRVIIKDGGCDAMKCGQNFHGGNVQNGCGFEFRWSQAKPYESTVAKPEEVKAEVEIPEIAREYVHEGIACDHCHKEIKGLRFRCIHCPTCDFCQNCEVEATMAHNKDHLFEIITKEGTD